MSWSICKSVDEDGVRGRLSAMDGVMRLLLPAAAEPEQRAVHRGYKVSRASLIVKHQDGSHLESTQGPW